MRDLGQQDQAVELKTGRRRFSHCVELMLLDNLILLPEQCSCHTVETFLETDFNPTSLGCDVAEPGSAELSQVILSFLNTFVKAEIAQCSITRWW